jgi:hypothetical protein
MALSFRLIILAFETTNQFRTKLDTFSLVEQHSATEGPEFRRLQQTHRLLK